MLARGKILSIRIRAMGGCVGSRLAAGRGTSLGQMPHSGLDIGDNVTLGRGVILDVSPGARLTIKSRVKVMHYSMVAAESSVTIGADTQIAEHCSIRDQDHDVDTAGTIATAPLRTTPVVIGSNVWIGRGVAVLRGAELGDGCVVGANAVVTAGKVPPDSICVGAPALVLRTRDKTI